MATSQLAYVVEKAIGHGEEYIKQDVSNYDGLGDPNEKMKALTWQGKNSVAVCEWLVVALTHPSSKRFWKRAC